MIKVENLYKSFGTKKVLQGVSLEVKDGETLVIGGMVQEEEAKTVKKVPLLGDLPVIGAAFRSESTNKTKSELVIMITPKIIKEGESAVADKL